MSIGEESNVKISSEDNSFEGVMARHEADTQMDEMEPFDRGRMEVAEVTFITLLLVCLSLLFSPLLEFQRNSVAIIAVLSALGATGAAIALLIGDRVPRTIRLAVGGRAGAIFQMAVAEFLVVSCAAYLASICYFSLIEEKSVVAAITEDYVAPAIIIAAIYLLIVSAFRQFSTLRMANKSRFLWSGFGAVTLAFSIFLTAMFIGRLSEDYSRGVFIFQFASVSIALMALRSVFYEHLIATEKSGKLEPRRLVIFGDPDSVELGSRLNGFKSRLVGSMPFPNFKSMGHADFLRQARNLYELCQKSQADDILLIVPSGGWLLATELADALSQLSASLYIVPAGGAEAIASSEIAELDGMKTIRLFGPPLTLFDQFAKRTFDIVVGLLGLVLLAPLLLLTGLAIKLDSRGPIVFRQRRIGYEQKPISIFKFRTMYIEDSDIQNKRRVTRVGRIISRLNLDTLPQVLNVLLGDISLIGPRPLTEASLAAQYLYFPRRLAVKPGITGWAQVHGFRGQLRSYDQIRRLLEYDRYYVNNWSFGFDIKIALLALFSSKGEYEEGYADDTFPRASGRHYHNKADRSD